MRDREIHWICKVIPIERGFDNNRGNQTNETKQKPSRDHEKFHGINYLSYYYSVTPSFQKAPISSLHLRLLHVILIGYMRVATAVPCGPIRQRWKATWTLICDSRVRVFLPDFLSYSRLATSIFVPSGVCVCGRASFRRTTVPRTEFFASSWPLRPEHSFLSSANRIEQDKGSFQLIVLLYMNQRAQQISLSRENLPRKKETVIGLIRLVRPCVVLFLVQGFRWITYEPGA